MDLAYALLEDYDAVILVDAAPLGEKPGTLCLIEPQMDQDGEVALDTHGMDPVKVLALARALGARPTRTWLVACEPARLVDGADSEDVLVELSEPVQAAVEAAVQMVEGLVEDISGVRGGEVA
jgi:hydrogenase maturation protease